LPVTAPELNVSGGAGGTYARLDDIALLADHSEQLGRALAAIAAECHSYLAHPDVLASAVLHPDGVLRFKARLLAALNGPSGLSALAAELGVHAQTLRASAHAYRVADDAQSQLFDMARWSAGHTIGTALSFPATGLPLIGGLAGLGAAGEAAGVDWQALLTRHPGVVEHVAGMGPGLISGLPGPSLATEVQSGARLLAMLYPDGVAEVTDLGADTHPATTRPPSGFEDLLTALEHRRDEASASGQGQVDVRVLTQPDGTRSFVVDIPGTRDWQPAPLQQYQQLNDLGTNLHAMSGAETAYQEGIVEALRRTGAGPDEPVMLVGHSQGGIVAAQTAASHSGEFTITHVVTVGSPVGHVDLPDDVQMLSLENEHDIVARLDGTGNPDRANHVTVSFATQHGGVSANHGIEGAYLPAATALDAGADPSVVAYRDSAAAFFAAESTVTSHRYAIERSHP
jgi:hypothetical protein